MESKTANGLVLFGGTGDLTKRKLMPAIYNLYIDNLLPDNFFVVAIGRRVKTRQEFLEDIKIAIKDFSRNKIDKERWEKVSSFIYYYQMDYTKSMEYKKLNAFLNETSLRHNTGENRIYYLAVGPESFGIIVDNLNKNGLSNQQDGYKRVVIEKPFGNDLLSARKLNEQITNVFDEDDIYRIDHYLGKEMLQNIMIIRFANAAFEPIWNSKHIDHVQITSSEMMGVNERGGYYEKAGALKDMVQNHLLQFLSLIAMEPPQKIDTESIRDEKVKVLKSLKIFNEEDVKQNVVRGQYGENKEQNLISYRDENRIANDSDTETYVALKININNERWKDVPFYVRTGKRMKNKGVQAVIEFKPAYQSNYHEIIGEIYPNQLVINIQPKEGVNFRFNAKKPGDGNDVVPVNMDFCQNCAVGYNIQEAYERLLLDVMKGDKTLFTRWDEVQHSWQFIDRISQAWNAEKPNFPNYKSFSDGPEAAFDLIKRDNRQWVNDY